jgi:hypothetical protein
MNAVNENCENVNTNFYIYIRLKLQLYIYIYIYIYIFELAEIQIYFSEGRYQINNC